MGCAGRDTGRQTQRCELELGDQAFGVPFSGFAVDQKAKSIFEAESLEAGLSMALDAQVLDLNATNCMIIDYLDGDTTWDYGDAYSPSMNPGAANLVG